MSAFLREEIHLFLAVLDISLKPDFLHAFAFQPRA